MAKNVVVICPSMGGDGAVGNVAIKQVHGFGPGIAVTFISDSFPPGLEAKGTCVKIKPRMFRWLHRLAHVPSQLDFAFKAKEAVKRLANEGAGFDCVIAHGHVTAALISSTLKNSPGSKLALVVHGDVFDRPRKMYGLPLLSLYKWAASRAYKRCDLIFTLSDYGQNLAISAGAPLEKVRVLPNAVEPKEIGLSTELNRSRNSMFASPLRLLFVGRLSHEKGVDVLLEACHVLQQQSVDLSLTIVGDGPEKQALMTKVKECHLNQMVEFLGRIERQYLGEIYLSHDIVCMPSRLEAFPLVALEAMASGALLMATTVGALENLLSDSCGVAIKENLASNWANALRKVLQDPDRAYQMACNGQAKVNQQHSWKVVSRRLQQVLYADDHESSEQARVS